MYTLIEIFDSKQYENIISSVSTNRISKIIFIGTHGTMTNEKTKNIKSFYKNRCSDITLEFLYVEKDNVQSVIQTLEKILASNKNCILDVTGGEDVILVSVGIFAERNALPIVRTNTKSGKFSLIYGSDDNIGTQKSTLTTTDFITLQGGKILSCQNITRFTKEESDDIKSLFSVNAEDCESYSIFCNFISVFVSVEKQTLHFPLYELEKKNSNHKTVIIYTLKKLCKSGLLKDESSENIYNYKIKSKIVSVCLKKSGNILEYYTALAASELPDLFSNISVGTSVEWNESNADFETQNEIDLTAVSNNQPVFISCKNGDVKKEALYELDTISRVLGGSYTKKILVCTYISRNQSSRRHFIKRAQDMNISIIYDTHKKEFSKFLNFLKNSVTN